jgi:hypothetical protein
VASIRGGVRLTLGIGGGAASVVVVAAGLFEARGMADANKSNPYYPGVRVVLIK